MSLGWSYDLLVILRDLVVSTMLMSLVPHSAPHDSSNALTIRSFHRSDRILRACFNLASQTENEASGENCKLDRRDRVSTSSMTRLGRASLFDSMVLKC